MEGKIVPLECEVKPTIKGAREGNKKHCGRIPNVIKIDKKNWGIVKFRLRVVLV